ncbi:MAG: hypothetical protein Q9227_003325 [Pyrenula ochraceoflavens]
MFTLAALCGLLYFVQSCLTAHLALKPSESIRPSQSQYVLSEPQTVHEQELSKIIDASPFLSFHRDLVNIPSVSLDEFDVGKYLQNYLRELNFTAQRQPVDQPPESTNPNPRYNIVARPDQAAYKSSSFGHGPKLILTSHIDTVPPFLPYKLSSNAAPNTALNKKDILVSGRGTVDAKACVAAQTYALISLLSAGDVDPGDVALVFVVGEEGFGDGMQAFSSSSINNHLADSYHTVIFGEPTEGRLAAGHKGVLGVRLTTHGQAVHSGYPWLGRSANSMILPILAKLDALGDLPENEGGLPASEKYGKTTVNIGRVDGGVAANVVAESAFATAAIRLAAGDAETAKRAISKAIFELTDDQDSIDLSFSAGYGPVDIDTDVEGFDTITVNYGTDIPNLKLRSGVKKYLYGPGSILVAHGPNEALTVHDLEEGLAGYKKLVLAALKK